MSTTTAAPPRAASRSMRFADVTDDFDDVEARADTLLKQTQAMIEHRFYRRATIPVTAAPSR